MTRQKVAMSVAALALSTVFVSGVALAQNFGRNPNDGGPIAEPAGSPSKPLYNSVPPTTPPHYGRNVNDNGMIDEPSDAAKAAAAKANKNSIIANKPHYGRNPNDNGSVD